MPKKRLDVLVLEPFFGGSHRAFLDNIMRLPFNTHLMDMPDRRWKWRMRLSAPHYANLLYSSGKKFDRILCSTFVDVAALRGLAPSWVRDVPVLTYYHENQFAYPVRDEQKRDINFEITNMTSALASDSMAFNSRFNLDTFLTGINSLKKQAHDMQTDGYAETIKSRSRVIAPGIDFSLIDTTARRPRSGQPPIVIWNHRWEYDKDPGTFFSALFELKDEGMAFELIVLGESPGTMPDIFIEAKERLADRIRHFGYAESRSEYASLLKTADIAVSTAKHEFFGISMMEATRAGCRPLLPRRLSYPELYPDHYIYDELKPALKNLLENFEPLDENTARELTRQADWAEVSGEFANWIESATVTG